MPLQRQLGKAPAGDWAAVQGRLHRDPVESNVVPFATACKFLAKVTAELPTTLRD
jgi:hypothetical protein